MEKEELTKEEKHKLTICKILLFVGLSGVLAPITSLVSLLKAASIPKKNGTKTVVVALSVIEFVASICIIAYLLIVKDNIFG